MRAVGAGHSWSDVALTDGYLVAPDGLGGLSQTRTTGQPHRRGKREIAGAGARRHPPARRSTPRSTRWASRCPTWAATTRRRSAAWSRPRPTAPAWTGGRSRISCARSTWSIAGGEVVRVEPAERADRPGFARRTTTGARARSRTTTPSPPPLRHRHAGPDPLAACIEVREKFWLNEVRTLSTWEAVARHAARGRRARRGRPLRAVRQPLRRQGRRAPGAGHAPRRVPRARRARRRTSSSATRSPSCRPRCR